MQALKLGLQMILCEATVIMLCKVKQNIKLLMDYSPQFDLGYDIFTDTHA